MVNVKKKDSTNVQNYSDQEIGGSMNSNLQMKNDNSVSGFKYGQMVNGNQMNGQISNGFASNGLSNGQMMNGSQMNGQISNGFASNGLSNGQMVNGNQMNGQISNGFASNGLSNGQMVNGNQMNGQISNGFASNGLPNGQVMTVTHTYGRSNNNMTTQMNGFNAMQSGNGYMSGYNYGNGQALESGWGGNSIGGSQTGTFYNPASSALDDTPAVFDEKALLEKMEREMVNSSEVQSLVQSIDLSNFDVIQMFGNEAMTEMNRVSDVVAQDQTRAMMLDGKTKDLLQRFEHLFDQIDPGELNGKSGLLGNLRKKVEAFIAKYQKVSVDIDKIYIELKKYEEESRAGNRKLAMMYDANLNTFHALKIYIFAAEQCTINLQKEIDLQTKLQQQTGNLEITHYINKLNASKNLMEKQHMTLLSAQNVALQALPQINEQQLTNYNIITKVNGYFLISLPIMKQGIAQAIMLKRQKLMTESLSDLDKKMNEMMVRNAQNTVETARNSMRLSEQTTISADTLTQTWKTIVSGIDEVNKIQAEGSKKRREDAKKLENIKKEFASRFGNPTGTRY